MVRAVTLVKADFPMLRAQRGRILGRRQGTGLVIIRELSELTRHLYFLYSKAMHREVVQADGTYALCEAAEAYARNFTGENEALSSENTLPWNESLENPGR